VFFAEDNEWVLIAEHDIIDTERVRQSLSKLNRDLAQSQRDLAKANRQLILQNRQLLLAASVFTHAHEGIMITKTDGTIIDVNDAFSLITGYSREETLGRNASMLSSVSQEAEFFTPMWRDLVEQGYWVGECWNQRKNDGLYAVMQTISAVRDSGGNIEHYVALFADITARKEYESWLEHIANYDVLTTLPNRALLAERLQQGMVQSRRRGQRLAVVVLDLDDFKTVNDNHGHKAGDQFLIAVASRLENTLAEGDTLARLGGDEFVVVLYDLPDREASIPFLSQILATAAEPVLFGEITLQVSALPSTRRQKTWRQINSCARPTMPCIRPNWRARTDTTSLKPDRTTLPVTKARKIPDDEGGKTLKLKMAVKRNLPILITYSSS